MGKQWHQTRIDGPLRHLEVHLTENTPSWRKYGSGHATVEFKSHDCADWLSLAVTEYSTDTNVSRLTMATIRGVPVAATLLKMLDKQIGLQAALENMIAIVRGEKPGDWNAALVPALAALDKLKEH